MPASGFSGKGGYCITMLDPEGNEFGVQSAKQDSYGRSYYPAVRCKQEVMSAAGSARRLAFCRLG